MKFKPLPPEDCDFEALKTGLTAFNESFTGPVFREKISSFIKDDSGKIVGGILGKINWGWLHIQGLWVDQSLRKGVGAQNSYHKWKNMLYLKIQSTSG